MKRIIYRLMIIMVFALSGIYYSCNNIERDEININKSDKADKLFLTNSQIELLNSKYPFINYKQGVNMRNDNHFINRVQKDLLEKNYSKLISNFDFSKVSVMEWEDYFSYILASKDTGGEYYTIIISKDENNVSKVKLFEKESFILNIDATPNGTGTLKETSKYGINTAVFDEGKLCSVDFIEYKPGLRGAVDGNGSFKACFEDAYDTICDGFIGCLAWYTNPTVPVTAAVWCVLQ